MIPPTEAIARILEHVDPLPPGKVPLGALVGRVPPKLLNFRSVDILQGRGE